MHVIESGRCSDLGSVERLLDRLEAKVEHSLSVCGVRRISPFVAPSVSPSAPARIPRLRTDLIIKDNLPQIFKDSVNLSVLSVFIKS